MYLDMKSHPRPLPALSRVVDPVTDWAEGTGDCLVCAAARGEGSMRRVEKWGGRRLAGWGTIHCRVVRRVRDTGTDARGLPVARHHSA